MPAFLVSWTEHNNVTAVIIAPSAEVALGVVKNEEVQYDSEVSTMDPLTLRADPMTDEELEVRLGSR
jgi:hypothetical protein